MALEPFGGLFPAEAPMPRAQARHGFFGWNGMPVVV